MKARELGAVIGALKVMGDVEGADTVVINGQWTAGRAAINRRAGAWAAIIMRQVETQITKLIIPPHKLIMMKQCLGQWGGWVGRGIWIWRWEWERHILNVSFHNRGVNSWQNEGLSHRRGANS